MIKQCKQQVKIPYIMRRREYVINFVTNQALSDIEVEPLLSCNYVGELLS